MISVSGLVKRYGARAVLDGLDLTVGRGEIVAVIGPSGSGKSTLLRCLNRLERPDGGMILVDGKDAIGASVDLAALRRKVGMVFQHFELFSHLSVLENVMFAPLRILGRSPDEAERLAREQLARVGLAARADAMPGELSGGECQRVSVARALAAEPEVLLLDEPTSSLDPARAGEVLAVVRKLAASGMTMLVVTHEMEFAREIATRIVYLDEGRVYEEGTPAELLDAPKRPKTAAFLRRLRRHRVEFPLRKLDFYGYWGALADFLARRQVPRAHLAPLRLVLEELLLNILPERALLVETEIGIVSETGSLELTVAWSGDPKSTDPLGDEDDETLISRRIVAGYSSHVFRADRGDGRRELVLSFTDPARA